MMSNAQRGEMIAGSGQEMHEPHLSPSDYNSDTSVMDATFGTTWYLIDTFEATPFLPGLTITLSGNISPSPVTWTSVPNLFNPEFP